jgi:hypothetical protein
VGHVTISYLDFGAQHAKSGCLTKVRFNDDWLHNISLCGDPCFGSNSPALPSMFMTYELTIVCHDIEHHQ